MRFVSLSSGSSGNCAYIGSESTHILVDAGVSCKKIDKSLNKLGLKSNELDGIFITHEHSDHIMGLGVFSKNYRVPIYGTKETLNQIYFKDKNKEIPINLYRSILPDTDIEIGDLTVCPFKNKHDAVNPVAYRVNNNDKAVAIVTDLGTYDDYTVSHLKDLDALLLEANYDPRMLETGKYPYPLKRRILGDYGHLSNESSGKLLIRIIHDKLQRVILGHLSKDNNYDSLAYEAVRMEITMGDVPYKADDFNISVANRLDMSEIVIV